MNPNTATEVVEAEGHLIDSQLLNAMFDTVVRHDASFEVLEFRIGRTNEEPSFVSMRVTAPAPATLAELLAELVGLGCRVARAEDVHVVPADRDGCAPEDFYSTTNHQTSIRRGAEWIAVERQRMDAAIVVENERAICRKLRDIRKGDAIVCGIHGIKIVPEFQARDRLGFAFMTNEISSERRVETGVARIAAMMKEIKRAGGRIAFVAGPVVVHTGGGSYFCDLVRGGYVDVLLAGNALAVHDVEQALFGTSLGVDLASCTRASRGTSTTCSPAAFETTDRCPTRWSTSSRRRIGTRRRCRGSSSSSCCRRCCMASAWAICCRRGSGWCASTSIRRSSRSSPIADHRRRSASSPMSDSS